MCLEWRILACHSERQRRISRWATRFFADAQNDTGKPMRFFLSDELMEQYIGINEFFAPLLIYW